MDKIVIYYHKESDTLDVWFGNPEEEYICEEAGEGIILKKDRNGKIIGFEKLYVSKTLGVSKPLPVEVVVAWTEMKLRMLQTLFDALIGFSLGFGFGYKDKLGINLAWTPSVSELNQHILNAGVSFKF